MMRTYLQLHWARWKRAPFLSLLLFCLPLFLLFGSFLGASQTTTDATVPIGWVDLDDSDFSKRVYTEVKKAERVTLVSLREEEAERAVQRGDVEAAFILKEGFATRLREGEINDVFTWLRSERSRLDVFVKEKIGEEMMRIALEEKAISVLNGYKVDATEREVSRWYNQYFEPEPLFQMEFSQVDRPYEDRSSAVQSSLIRSILVAYTLLYFLYLLRFFTLDKHKGRFMRISIMSRVPSYYGWNCAFFVVCGLLFYVVGDYIGQALGLIKGSSISHYITLVLLMLLFFIVLLIGRKRVAVLVVLAVSVGALFVGSLLLQYGMVSIP
ncbi:hypothetical protein N781_06595 [Pontibacillus halophilus JSM 076056 = DSM 19796]|uniref:ABC-2 type transporter transmembrane domain-containing protein n=1 Tax=Pontibacillus halophilus JSM 076056 = DSM 19796 TaxID=1385510 RepID=A0A0A5GHQ8_9BACI|nr:ABC transporter permease [Pontibacillus halophilus]KGX90763.1 hypothetical protein N781_06595 [Pontibacillus halophilus JSM 076056 = DSM 19796]